MRGPRRLVPPRIFVAARAGEFTAVDPTLADLIGHEPLSFDAVLCESASLGMGRAVRENDDEERRPQVELRERQWCVS